MVVGYTVKTSLKLFSTIPATLFYGSSSSVPEHFIAEFKADPDVWDLMRGQSIARTLYQLLSTRRKAQARVFLRISRSQGPPRIDPVDATRTLWDWAPVVKVEAIE